MAYVHRLEGCRPLPLADYLKALGVLRLVASQADPGARGCFVNDVFTLVTSLSRDDLEDFFLTKYAPTPLIAPWNGGSGFYPKDNRKGFDAVRCSFASRLESYRKAIELGIEVIGAATEAPKEAPKFAMQREIKRLASSELLEWLSAVVAFDADGEPRYPALLGTGGNDGRLDFTNNFMQRLADLLDCGSSDGRPAEKASRLLHGSLFDVPLDNLESFSIGQFDPGGAGGANSGFGFEGSPSLNPWDFVLMLEGAVLMQVSIVKQLGASGGVQAGAPFAFRASAVGYGSSADADEGARGEQWMPLWSKPASLAEVRTLFAEGRAQVGRGNAERPIDFARSLARLGVTRGVSAFQRFGYIERNGQANLAVPLARWRVSPRPHQDLVDNVAGWIEQLRRAGGGDNSPSSVRRAARECEEGLIGVLAHGSDALRWRRLLAALGRAERALAHSGRFTREKNLRPIPGLAPGWLEVAADASSEWRVASAVASLHGTVRAEKALLPDWGDSLRRAALPLTGDGERFETSEAGLAFTPSQVLRGAGIVDDMQALVIRRALYPHPSAAGTLGLRSAAGLSARVVDVMALIEGRLDERLLQDVFRALLAIRWNEVGRSWAKRSEIGGERSSSDGAVIPLALFRSSVLLGPTLDSAAVYPRLDLQLLRFLQGGQVGRAAQSALRRLRASGVVPKLDRLSARAEEGPRLLAALAVPLDGELDFPRRRGTALGQFEDLVCKPETLTHEGDSP